MDQMMYGAGAMNGALLFFGILIVLLIAGCAYEAWEESHDTKRDKRSD